MKRLAIAALAFGATLSAHAQEDSIGPFGLAWMATAEQVKQLGVTLTPFPNDAFGTSFSATNLPKSLADMEMVVLSFGFDDNLWRVAALGAENANDKYGSQGKARYDQLKESLSKTYKSGVSGERPSTDSFYGDPENFAYALSQNEAFWYSVFSSPVAEIELSLNSNHYDTYWRLIYAHLDGKAAFEASKNDAELDAL